MKIPPSLQPGDTIGIVSTASRIEKKMAKHGIRYLEKLGYKVQVGKHAFDYYHQYSSTDENRTADLQKMLDNPEIKAIVCSRGGYGTLRTLINIDWSKFDENPKWIVGFSDITVLHSALNNRRAASLHGVMPRYFLEDDKPTPSFTSMLEALQGKELAYTFPVHKLNRLGSVTGELVGGNLSILYSLRATPYDLDVRGKILFIEDLSEYMYHLDRMIMNLKVGGYLSELAGLVVGGFTGLKDYETPFGKSFQEIIYDAIREYSYPVAFHFPAGHQPENFALPLGCQATLQVGTDNSILHVKTTS